MDHFDTATSAAAPSLVPHLVEIFLNEQPVSVPHRSTGLQIKQAAIAQGVSIKSDFILTEERPNGRDQIIGDQEEISVHAGTRFMAVAPDDNS